MIPFWFYCEYSLDVNAKGCDAQISVNGKILYAATNFTYYIHESMISSHLLRNNLSG